MTTSVDLVAAHDRAPAVDDASDRARDLQAFLCCIGWEGAEISLLAADASFRCYHRLVRPDGARAVLMDAPPPREDTLPFMRLSSHLAGLGLSVPVVMASDTKAGFLLLDDLGDNTFMRLLNAGSPVEELYTLAVDGLLHLHSFSPERVIPDGLASYDEATLVKEARVFVDWYLPACKMPAPPEAIKEFEALWHDLAILANDVPQTLVLRDVHVDNLMLKSDCTGVRCCAFLDFQDALAGPITYDLMSLLEDRRDIPDLVAWRLKQHYLSASKTPIDADAFETSWTVLSVQRHLKVIGVFTRLDRRDGKPAYLSHLPRLWRLVETRLSNPVLAPLGDWLARYAPDPDNRLILPETL